MLHYDVYYLQAESEWVVFIHGAGGSSAIWYRQIKRFRRNFNVLLLDLRGHGKSRSANESASSPYSFRKICFDIMEVLDHLGIWRGHLIAVSLGTILARELAEIARERVQSLVLAGAITHLNVRAQILMHFGNACKSIIPYMWLYQFFAWVIMPGRRHRDARSLFFKKALHLSQSEFIRWYALVSDVRALLRRFEQNDSGIKTLYIMGDRDYMFLPHVKYLAQNHSSAEVVILPNSGHVCCVEQAVLFNEHVIAFIDRHGKLSIGSLNKASTSNLPAVETQ